MEIVRVTEGSATGAEDPPRPQEEGAQPPNPGSAATPPPPALPETDQQPAIPTRAESNATILLWQARLRIDFALLVGVLAIGAIVAGWSSDVPGVLLGTIAAYVAAIGMLAVAVRQVGRAESWALVATVAADILFLFGTTFLIVPAQYYDRTLLLAFVILHLTEFHFGRVLAWGALAAIAASYVAIVTYAGSLGTSEPAWQAFWSVLVFVTAGSIFLWHRGSVKRRLTRLSMLLEHAAAGDFTEAYEPGRDRRPDAITLVGHSYDRVRAQLATMVLTDPLSGCLNRRGLEQQLVRELNRAQRERANIALIVLDVDYFKRINDTFGHLAGDSVIREIGFVLRDAARGGDLVARLGGDEFAVLLPGTGDAGAFRMARRLHSLVSQRRFEAMEGRLPVTVSVGVVSTVVRDENAAHDLLSRADEALYAAKDGGRNRVAIWTPNLRVLALARAGEQAAGR